MTHIFKLLFLSLSLFISSNVFAQKHYSVKIQFLPEVNVKEIRVFVKDGKDYKKIDFNTAKNHAIFSGVFYSKYATVQVLYGEDSDFLKFWVSDKAATVTLGLQENSSKVLEIKKQENIYELSNMGEKQLKDFVAKENQDLEDFLAQNKGWNSSDSLTRVMWSKRFKIESKTIDYVKNNGNEYYSLWLFTNQVVNSHTSIDSLIKIFNTTFPEHFKRSFEGKEALKYLNARNIKKGVEAPNLIAKDLKGKTISLDKYRKKYVLLSFWSTTCVPCIAEMPTLVKIKNQYPPQKLDVIAISSDDNMMVLSKAIRKYQMNWTNIADTTGDLFKTYGVQSIPQVYLIDETGKIVYSREEENDNEPELIVLNKVLAEKMSK